MTWKSLKSLIVESTFKFKILFSIVHVLIGRLNQRTSKIVFISKLLAIKLHDIVKDGLRVASYELLVTSRKLKSAS